MSRKYNSDHLEKTIIQGVIFKRELSRRMIQCSVHKMHFRMLEGFPDVFLKAVIMQYLLVKD